MHSFMLALDCSDLNCHVYEMAHCATIFCAQKMTLESFSQLAKKLRLATEVYNVYILQQSTNQ